MNDIKAIISDFSRVLLFPTDVTYKGGLNDLHKKLTAENPNYTFRDYFMLNVELLSYFTELNKRFPIYIFTSDTIQDHPAIKETIHNAVTRIFSAKELGLAKDHPEAYKQLAELIRIDPVNILYIDDQTRNEIAAQVAGLHTLLYSDNKTLLQHIGRMINV